MTSRNKSTKKQIGKGVKIYVDFGNDQYLDLGIVREKPQEVNCGVTFGPDPGNWKELIRRKISATTLLEAGDLTVSNDSDISGECLRYVNFPSSPLKQRLKFVGDASSLCDLPGSPVDGPLASADNAAKTVFVKRANKFIQAVDGLTFLGELRQTVDLFKHPVKRLRGRVDDLFREAKKLRKDKKAGRRLRNSMSDLWLEWRFGVQPLVSDIYGAADALSRIHTFHPPSRVVTSESNREEVAEVVNSTSQHLWVRMNTVVQKVNKVQVRYKGVVSTSFPGYRIQTGQFGISWNNVLPAAWELIPYSFLIDYFTNAGEIVGGLSFARSAVTWLERGVCITRENRLISAQFQELGGDASAPILSNSLTVGGGCIYSRSSKLRENYDGSLCPSLEFEIPGFKDSKWINVAALAAQGREINGRTYRY
jgi:hypothetical protein